MAGVDLIPLAALVLVCFTTLMSYGNTRRELTLCKRDRLELRRNLQVVVSALLATLPLAERVGLLQSLDEWVRPEKE